MNNRIAFGLLFFGTGVGFLDVDLSMGGLIACGIFCGIGAGLLSQEAPA